MFTHKKNMPAPERRTLDGTDPEECILNHNDIFKQGEFHVCLRWGNHDRKILHLQKKSTFNGMRIRIFVGVYVGPEHFAIAALQASRKNAETSAALRGLLAQHTPSVLLASPTNNPIYGLSTGLLNEVLKRHEMQVSSEMIPVVERWSTSTSGCLSLAAAPGAGKSMIASSVLVATMKKLKPNECLAVLSMKRGMRDDRLKEVRSFAEHPLEIIGLGRALYEEKEDGKDEEWDVAVSSFLEKRLGTPLKKTKDLAERTRECSDRYGCKNTRRTRVEAENRKHACPICAVLRREAGCLGRHQVPHKGSQHDSRRFLAGFIEAVGFKSLACGKEVHLGHYR